MLVLIAAPTAAIAVDSPHRPSGVGSHRLASRSTSTTVSKSRAPQVYLALVGPTPLRFADPEPGLPPEPVMPAPQVLPVSITEQNPGKHSVPGTTPTTEPGSTASEGASTPDAAKPLDPTQTPPRIIPDDMIQEVRPEDVLPFFQLPAGEDALSVAIPLTLPSSREPNTQPVSSATYRQQ